MDERRIGNSPDDRVDLQRTREQFAEHSLRCTAQRVAVFHALQRYHGHPTAEELFRIVKPTTDKLSLATVYNTLEALSKAGLIRRLPMTNGTCRYDSDTEPHLHVRFPATAEIEDVPETLSAKLMDHLPQQVLEEIADALGVQLDGVSIQILATRRAPSASTASAAG
jgi:Fe2+ or Zn2+ uptake regulation protein